MTQRRKSDPVPGKSSSLVDLINPDYTQCSCENWFSLSRFRRKRYSEKLLEWQEQQSATSIIDNTVNRMVDSYMQISQISSPAVITINDESSYDSDAVREAAIMWAINSHGLDAPPVLTDDALNEQATSPSDWSESVLGAESSSTESTRNNDETEQQEHTDFMDLAVSAAIQERGLITPSTSTNP